MRSKISAKIISGSSVSCRWLEYEQGDTYELILFDLGINPETVMVLSDGSPVPVDDSVQPGDLTIVRVISSG